MRLAAATALACGLALTAPAMAQFLNPQNSPAPGAPRPTPGMVQPRLEFDAREHNFGKIWDTDPHTHEFRFTNRGPGTLKIANVHGSCGCTVPALTKTEYAPGESGSIKVTFNPHGRRGPQQTTVTVTSNDPTQPTTILSVRSEVTRIVDFDPAFASFGQVNRGEDKSITVNVIGRTADFAATAATGLDERHFAVELGQTETFKDAEGNDLRRTPVKITLKSEAPVGFINQALAVRTNDPRPAGQLVTLNVMAQVMPVISANPQAVSLGLAAVGAPVRGEFRIEHRQAKPFKVSKVEAVIVQVDPSRPVEFASPLKFEVVPADPKAEKPSAYLVRYTGSAPAAPGQLRGDFVITTDVEGEGETRVPFFANVLEATNVAPNAPTQLKSGEVILRPNGAAPQGQPK